MTTTTYSDDKTASFVPAALLKRPYLGFWAVGFVLAWQALGHTTTVFLNLIFPGDTVFLAAVAIGLMGFGLVWRGFDKDELTATGYGFFGGALIWIGWFEYMFEYMSHVTGIEPVMYEGQEFLSPNLQFMEATAIMLLGVLILLGLNKDTRCRMFKWFHRNARLKPEAPTVGYRRQYSRITALEVIALNWTIYVICILMLDPRLFVPGGVPQLAVLTAYLGWCVYLVTRLPQQSGVAPTIRYAVGAGIVIWLIPEVLSAFQIMTEVWLRPFQFPVSNAILALFFVYTAYAFLTASDRGVLPKGKPSQS